MYIKQVIIQGFKSYRDQTIIEPFSKRHNVVVGRNGSGKSNFFSAIQFVLSDEYSHLSAAQRQALLHEGTGARVISAFVEIIFDNSDNRLPVDRDEVVIRRVIGSKKDQYFLDKKMVTKTDIMNMLESAGFSRCNPYYIVKQGKIIQIATAADAQRLKLLKEVAGTRVYDERKEESLKILEENQSKREKIREYLDMIREKLKTLETEKEELKEYQRLDRMRRALEYTIHQRDNREIDDKLREIRERRDNSGKISRQLEEKLAESSKHISEVSHELLDVRTRLQTIVDDKEQLSKEQRENLQRKAKLELDLKDFRDDREGEVAHRQRAEKELKDINKKIKDMEKKLEEVVPRFDSLRFDEEERLRNREVAELKRKELYAKEGRGTTFGSKEDRDKWIQKEVLALDQAVRAKKDEIGRVKKTMETDKDKGKSLRQEIDRLNTDIEQNRKHLETNNKMYYELKQKVDDLTNKRNELWRKENALQQEVSATKEELRRKEQALRSVTGRGVLNGIDSVNQMMANLSERGGRDDIANGYYGTLIENFECEDTFHTAIEVTGGGRLFYHLVDSDRTATKLLQEINRQKLSGELNFLPLNVLRSEPVRSPESTPDAVPLISKLTFDASVKNAVNHVFGRVLLCRNMEVAAALSRELSIDCVTLEGDQVSHKGSLTGGYIDHRQSRLGLQREKRQLQARLDAQQAEQTALSEQLRETDDQLTKASAEMQRSETKTRKYEDMMQDFKTNLRFKKDELDRIDKSQKPKESQLNGYESSLEALLVQKSSLEDELGSDLHSQLSSDENDQLEQLNRTIDDLSHALSTIRKDRMKFEKEKNELEIQLHNNLFKKREQLMSDLQEVSTVDRDEKIRAYEKELEVITGVMDGHERRLKEIERDVSSLQDKEKRQQSELEKWQAKERHAQDELEDDSKSMEKLRNKEAVLTKKKLEAQRKIRELGSLPADAFDKYTHHKTKELYAQLEECNQDLKKYSHVNKKALDQYMSFSEQQEKLASREQELNRGYESIQDLINGLDHKKYEAILFTFKQVSKYFSEIFHRLVPGGSAELVLKKRDPNDEPSQESDASQQEGQMVDQFSGVGIKVSFAQGGEMREMQQLSGGQKSLVALTLIFAIQKCDPAPFYLFDEIDAALDAHHRKAVADMIHELAEMAQFITTTFRPELLENADKYYGVTFRNKVSHIDCVTKQEAADFVEDDTTRQ